MKKMLGIFVALGIATLVGIGASSSPAAAAAGPSATYICNYPAGNPDIMAPDWDTAIAYLAQPTLYWNPRAVPGALAPGQGETLLDQAGNPFHLDCAPHLGTGVWLTMGYATSSTAVDGAPGWYQEATS